MSNSQLQDVLEPLIADIFGGRIPLPVRLWDGTTFGPSGGADVPGRADAPGTMVFNSPDAFRRMAYSPNLLGLGRAFAAGDIDVEGDMVEAFDTLWKFRPHKKNLTLRTLVKAVGSAKLLGAVGKPLAPPPEEAPSRRKRRSKSTDAEAVHHHYDVSNEFYELFLGETMAYTCARFEHENQSLEDAQRSKFDLVCRKLELQPDHRLLDIGCGWGGLAMHAAENFGARVVAVNVSKEQVAWGRAEVRRRGLEDLVDIRDQDYRETPGDEKFDAISAIGVLEHVGRENTPGFFSHFAGLLKPRGRMLNHCITKVGGAEVNSFSDRYIFPDGDLQDVGSIVLRMEEAGLEVRDFESLREHYDETLCCWVDNLEKNWDQAVELVGENRARVWRLYMAADAIFFRRNGIGLHQVLGVKSDVDGISGMPRTRKNFV